MRVCPRCGRTVSTVIDGLCPQCYAETRGFVRLPDRVDVEICRYCGSLRLGGKWVSVRSFSEAVETVVEWLVSRAKPDPRFRLLGVGRLDYRTLPNWRTLITVTLRGVVEDVVVEQLSELEVRLRPGVCPVCKTRVSGEYDTVLQIRGLRSAGVSGVELEERVIGESLRLGLGRHLVDVIVGRDGVDVYFTNSGSARKLAKRLANIYGGRVSKARYETVTITGSGKSRARKTILLRLGRD